MVYTISVLRSRPKIIIMKYFRLLQKKLAPDVSHSVRDYQALVRKHLRRTFYNPRLALANVIGSETMELFVAQGDGQVAVLRHHGLADGMAVYDLGCGCGRTAQALQRQGWIGRYTGADVVPELLAELAQQCPGYRTVLSYDRTILSEDASLDMVFNWSVFTHLFPAESFLYMQDAFRSLKPGGKLLFSFLELEAPQHDRVWQWTLSELRKGHKAEQLDNFLHRDWIRRFARDAGFSEPQFTDGTDESHHPQFWQSLAVMEKPGG
jgi:SAM-dependent methyltransferase